MASQRSRLAADWEPSDDELAAIQADEEAAFIAEFQRTTEPSQSGEADPRWLRGGASHQKFSSFATDEEEEEARQSAREQNPWDTDAQWVRDMMQPTEVASIPRTKGSCKNKRKRRKPVLVPKHTDRIDDNPAQECVKLFRFRARVSPGEYYFYEIRPGYALIVVRRYLAEIRENGFERRDTLRRFMTAGISRNRRLSMYVEEQELKELAICPGGAMRALTERARVEDPVRVNAVDQTARRPRPLPSL